MDSSDPRTDAFEKELSSRGITRREFLKFCAVMSAALALPTGATSKIAQALAATSRPLLVWLEFQDCTGDTESFLRSGQPSVVDLVLDTLSLNYHETLMVPAGSAAEKSLSDTLASSRGKYICVVEGSIPTASNGVYCTVAGRTAQTIAREVCGNAAATIAVGTCASYGGWRAAAPNPTGAVGVRSAVPGLANLVNLPGCPVNVVNLTATVVHYLTYSSLPERDDQLRPKAFYEQEIHEHCPRHDHFEEGRFVLAWGDQGHRNGWCLRKMGCRGPETRANCPSVKWNGATGWPIGSGHGCIGCTQPQFWDRFQPFYAALPADD